MKRSQINEAIAFAKTELSARGIRLPKYAYWSKDEWRLAGSEVNRVRINELGWTVTDFGSGDFEHIGLVMFDLRNGNSANPEQGTPYGEKFLIFRPGQRTPLHRHFTKIEDIINRFGGTLTVELYNVASDGSVDRDSGGAVFCDGVRRTFGAGEIVEIGPGESITITTKIFHSIGAKEADGVLIGGEVTTVCDPHRDNHFPDGSIRYMDIEEDEDPLYLLNTEYPNPESADVEERSTGLR